MSEVYCPYCGTVSKPDEAFCNNCGANLDADTSPRAAPPTQIAQTYQQPYQSTSSNYQSGTKTQTTVRPPVMKNQAADLSLVFAIIGLFIIPVIGGLLGIIFGIVGVTNPYNRKKAVIGIILGLIQSGAILSILLFWL